MQKKEAVDQKGSKYDLVDPLVAIPSDYDIVTY